MKAGIVFIGLIALAALIGESATASLGRQFVPAPTRRTPIAPEKTRDRPPRVEADFWQIPDKEIPDKAKLANFESAIAGKTVSYLYYLPPGYESDNIRRFPVVYLLPGLGGDCREAARMIPKFDEAIGLRICPAVIVVAVQGILGSMYTDAKDGGRPIESVIMKELIPHIDRTYRTRATPESRGIEGFAMGGYGALHLAFKYPGTFGAVSAFAPPTGTLKAMRDESPKLATDVWADDQKYFDDNDPYLLVAHNASKLRGKIKLRLMCGSDDRYRMFADDLHDRLAYLDIDHDFKIVPGVKHNEGQLLQAISAEVFPFWADAFSGAGK